MKKLFSSPLFSVGLLIRLMLIGLLLPQASTHWYAPFLDITTRQFTLDPWGTWLSQGGSPTAFPYGYVMWLAFLPLTLLCKLLDVPVLFGYGFTLVGADLGMLMLLRKMLPGRDRLLLLIYWLSPIVLLATYGFGLNDLIPVLLLGMALYLIRQLRLFPAGVLCGAAISAKLSMVLAVPFFLIYLIHNRAMRQLLPGYLKGMAVAVLLLFLPFAFSTSGLNMLFSNPEMGKVYHFALKIGTGISIYVLPMAYLVMLYAAWRVRRLNFELFNAILGTAFLLVVLLTPASPGWFIWIMPLLVFYQAMSGRIAIGLVAIFSVLYVLSSLLVMPLPALALVNGVEFPAIRLSGQLGEHVTSLLHTAKITIGVILAIRIWRETISINDYFRLSRKPFVMGISGNSGAGKSTLANALEGLFGNHSVARLSGDDYHLWDRQKPMWQVMTHLNPMANDLERFARDLLALIDGRSILMRRYDHETGQMGRPVRVKSNDFIIASGLHTLYLPFLRNCYDLSIYLDIDEGLRRHFKLQRDVHQRGHSVERRHSVERVLPLLEKQEPDSANFIRPQAMHADLVMSLQPIHPRILEDASNEHPPRFKLFVRSRYGSNELSLTRALVAVCGLHVDINMNNDATEVDLTIEGETSSEDIALAARLLLPRVIEFLDITPQWKDGALGLMQLITLSHINQALNKRLLW